MATIIDKLSVFLPIYNEEANIKSVTLATIRVLQVQAAEWELIVVNDGSTDRSAEIIEELARSEKRIKVVTHKVNEGYGASIASGLYESKYPWISFMDSDGQFNFAEIEDFIRKQKETNADLVIGFYKKRRVSTFKKITSKLWEFTVFALFGLKVRDIDCGFKLISKSVIDTIPRLESQRGAFISSELLVKSVKAGFKIAQVPVTHYPRTKGAGTGRNLNVIIKSFADLFRLWKKLR
ncbi:MAG: glycosyltransferase family 2 protein [Candidatus Woesebacteria bacterium]|nr:glycosyltransferase family 2 protein [Candidatus Woesebacteria bacterium]